MGSDHSPWQLKHGLYTQPGKPPGKPGNNPWTNNLSLKSICKFGLTLFIGVSMRLIDWYKDINNLTWSLSYLMVENSVTFNKTWENFL